MINKRALLTMSCNCLLMLLSPLLGDQGLESEKGLFAFVLLCLDSRPMALILVFGQLTDISSLRS